MTLTRWLDEVTLTWWTYYCEAVYVYHIFQVPLTKEEARELVHGPARDSPQYACFTPTHPDWDCNTIEGKRRPFVHPPSQQTGLKVTARCFTNLSRVYNIRQRENKSTTAFLDRAMETFFDNTPPWTLNHQKQRLRWLELLSIREHQLWRQSPRGWSN